MNAPASAKPSEPTATGDRMVYWCPSDTVPGRNYRCDLIANAGAGQCTCTDFTTRRQIAIDGGAESWTRDTACKHLRKVARHFMRELFAAMAKEESQPIAR